MPINMNMGCDNYENLDFRECFENVEMFCSSVSMTTAAYPPQICLPKKVTARPFVSVLR